jgi:hypothetical protein
MAELSAVRLQRDVFGRLKISPSLLARANEMIE